MHPQKQGRVAQLNSASDYGSEGCRFESCRGHFLKIKLLQNLTNSMNSKVLSFLRVYIIWFEMILNDCKSSTYRTTVNTVDDLIVSYLG